VLNLFHDAYYHNPSFCVIGCTREDLSRVDASVAAAFTSSIHFSLPGSYQRVLIAKLMMKSLEGMQLQHHLQVIYILISKINKSS
jgi:AAA+ superfamily predicted ATPase